MSGPSIPAATICVPQRMDPPANTGVATMTEAKKAETAKYDLKTVVDLREPITFISLGSYSLTGTRVLYAHQALCQPDWNTRLAQAGRSLVESPGQGEGTVLRVILGGIVIRNLVGIQVAEGKGK